MGFVSKWNRDYTEGVGVGVRVSFHLISFHRELNYRQGHHDTTREALMDLMFFRLVCYKLETM